MIEYKCDGCGRSEENDEFLAKYPLGGNTQLCTACYSLYESCFYQLNQQIQRLKRRLKRELITRMQAAALNSPEDARTAIDSNASSIILASLRATAAAITGG